MWYALRMAASSDSLATSNNSARLGCGWLPMFEKSKLFRSRVARRLFLLFLLCALIPIIVSAGLSFSELNRMADKRDAEQLARLAHSRADDLATRLYSADETLRALLADANSSIDVLRMRTAQFKVFASVRSVPATQSRLDRADTRYLPWPDAEQQSALAVGRSVLLWSRFPNPNVGRAFLVRQRLRGDPWLYAELRPDYLTTGLWDATGDAPQAGVLGPSGQPLLGFEADPFGLETRIAAVLQEARNRGSFGSALEWDVAGETWRANVVEVYLRAAYVAPSVFVVALNRRGGAAEEVRTLRAFFPTVTMMAVLLAVLLALRQIRTHLTPLDRLMQGTARIAEGRFDEAVEAGSGDEFAELAGSFNAMSASLKQQFATLAAMSDVDRLLLGSKSLETVLESVTPPIASVCGAQSVLVLLLDDPQSGRLRIYEHNVGAMHGAPIRRAICDAAELLKLIATPRNVDAQQLQSSLSATVQPGHSGIAYWEIVPLQYDSRPAGALCLGYTTARDGAEVTRASLEFGARLNVVMRNLAHEARLFEQAHFDDLTGLPNRISFRSRLTTAVSAALAEQAQGALLFIDLDHFKRINDTSGHPAGDELLRVVAHRLQSLATAHTTVARLGGDEFAVVLDRIDSPEDALRFGERCQAALSQGIQVGGREIPVSASIGVTVFPRDGTQSDALIKNSDIAMYCAKEGGRNRIALFEQAMLLQMHERASIEAALRAALRDGLFELNFQPICRGIDRETTAAESLLRCRDPRNTTAYLSPATFIPVAEDSGLIEQIGAWVLEQSCAALARWNAAGIELEYLSVNVSPRQFAGRDLINHVQRLLQLHQIRPNQLQLEVTESVLADRDGAGQLLGELHALGLRIALDDFGTGYSSLSYLRSFPFHTVKIDRSFIVDLPDDPSACRLVDTILGMARALDKYVVAEGVETERQLSYLRSRQCDAVQGYLLGRPTTEALFVHALVGDESAMESRQLAS